MTNYRHESGYADNFRLYNSKFIKDPSDGLHTVVLIPYKAFVRDIWVWVTDVWAADSEVIVGYTGNGETSDPDAFFKAGEIILTQKKMFRASVHGASPYSTGKWFQDGSGVISITTTKGSASSVYSLRVFVDYTVVH